MTQRIKTIRVPIAVDEQGNCYVHGWAFGKPKKGRAEDYGDMEEQTRDMHYESWQQSKTVVVRWATIEVPLPDPSSEIEGTAQAE